MREEETVSRCASALGASGLSLLLASWALDLKMLAPFLFGVSERRRGGMKMKKLSVLIVLLCLVFFSVTASYAETKTITMLEYVTVNAGETVCSPWVEVEGYEKVSFFVEGDFSGVSAVVRYALENGEGAYSPGPTEIVQHYGDIKGPYMSVEIYNYPNQPPKTIKFVKAYLTNTDYTANIELIPLEEIAAMQNQIATLQQQNADQQQRLEEDRYLLEQLSQLRKKIEELKHRECNKN